MRENSQESVEKGVRCAIRYYHVIHSHNNQQGGELLKEKTGILIKQEGK